MHMLYPCHSHATHSALLLIYGCPTFAVRVAGLPIDGCHGSYWTSRFRSGVSGRKPLRRVSAQILTFTHPRYQNVYERVDTPLAALFTPSCSLTTMLLHVATLSDCILPSLHLSARASIRPITSHVSATFSMCSAQLSV